MQGAGCRGEGMSIEREQTDRKIEVGGWSRVNVPCVQLRTMLHCSVKMRTTSSRWALWYMVR